MITDLFAIPRPEGAVVNLHFGFTSDVLSVRVLRTQGQAITGPNDANAAMLFDALPKTVGKHPYVVGVPNPPFYADLIDINFYQEQFEDKSNILENLPYTYHVFALTSSGYLPAVTASATPNRRVETSLGLDVKSLLYQRIRYHTKDLGIDVIKSENFLEERGRQILIKTRMVLNDLTLSGYELKDAQHKMFEARVIAEINIVAESPDERDDIGNFVQSRLISDIMLFSELGWNNINFSSMDALYKDILRYRREISMDGVVDGLISTQNNVLIQGVEVLCGH